MFIDHVQLSPERIEECELILTDANTALKKWHSKAKKVLHKRRLKTNPDAKLPRYNRRKFQTKLLKSMNSVPTDVMVFGFTIPQADVEKIKAAKDIEWELLQSFARAITKHAYAWARRCHDRVQDVEDLESVAVEGFLVSTVYYRKSEGTRFSTYVRDAIYHYIMRACIGSNSFSKWSTAGRKLFRRFSEHVKKGNVKLCDQIAGLNLIAEEMGLSDEERDHLRCMLRPLMTASASRMEKKHRRDNSCSEDYSGFNTELPGYGSGESYECHGTRNGKNPLYMRRGDGAVANEESEYVSEKVEQLKSLLDGFEKIVFDAYLKSGGKRGWQAQVAKENVNPDTGKPYTRMAVYFANERVQEKLRKIQIAA